MVTFSHLGVTDGMSPVTLTARFSGTPAIMPAMSQSLTISPAGVGETIADPYHLTVTTAPGQLMITGASSGIVTVYTTADQTVTIARLNENGVTIPLSAGLYIVAGRLVYVP